MSARWPASLPWAVILVSALPAVSAAAQTPPGSSQGPVDLQFDTPASDQYGTPMQVALWDLARSQDRYQKEAVITTGYVDPFDAGYLRLSDTGASVLLIPVNGDMQARMRAVWGGRVEVTGVVRRLRRPQPPCGVMHWSVCEDPDLPQLPDLTPGREGWPKISVTVWAVTDASERGPKGKSGSAAALLETIAGNPADYAGRSVTVLGQFRGHNLFGDLPGRAWGRDDDWVLKSGEGAVWVTGKKPRGKGWSLDLSYEPDSRFWLEVTGEIVVVGGVACLKAKSVALAKAPPGGPR